MSNYLALKNQQQEEINAFPIAWAFNDEQFKQGMESLGLAESDTHLVVSIGFGGFLLKENAPKLREMQDRHIAERLHQLESCDEYVYDMFFYELGNHEYIVTFEEEETLEACGLTWEQLGKNKRLYEIFKEARQDYVDSFDEEKQREKMYNDFRLTKDQQEVIEAILGYDSSYDVEELIDRVRQHDGIIVWDNCRDMGDVAHAHLMEDHYFSELPSYITTHFDFDSYGESLKSSGTFISYEKGIIELYF